MALKSHTRPTLSPPKYMASRWRRAIIAFVAVVGMLMLMLNNNAIAMLMKYKNSTNKNENLQNIYNEADDNKLVSGIEMVLLTREFAATINANNNKSNREQQLYEIIAADENSGNSATAVQGSNNNLLATALSERHLNPLDNAISISNQRNEFVERTEAAVASAELERATGKAAPSSIAASLTSLVATKSPESDGLTYVPPSSQMQQQQQLQPHDRSEQHQENTELVLHRHKRYLVFPEGSSFQMVFDLIIGMVDYTSYLILGITCAVAWELPSKPPSELIESLHEKITEGIYPTSETKPTAMRRNDSTVVTNGNGDSKYGMNAAGIKYVDNANVAGHTVSNYENMLQSPVVIALPAPLPPPISSPPNAMESAYYTQTRQPNPFASPNTGYEAYHKVAPVTNYYAADGAYRPTNYYANTHSSYDNKKKYYRPSYKYSFADKNEKSSYSGVRDSTNNEKPFGYSASGDSTDKQPVKFANRWQQQQQRHQQPQYKKWQSWQDYDSNWQPYQQQHAKWAQQQQKWATRSKYAETDDWWLRNKQHVANGWQTKQNKLRADNVRIPEVPAQQTRQPVVAYASSTESLRRADATITTKAVEAEQGRSSGGARRPLLSTRPKAKIYPVFGRRRRRRRSSDTKLNAFELKLERIHLREQLVSRRKLYGKIEKLYETRGQNGTACVLRALCETGQQQMEQHEDDKAEPQSFITELLRAIFVLPTTTSGSVEFAGEPALHPTDLHIVDRPYREAQAHRGSCAELFAMCEHSIWE